VKASRTKEAQSAPASTARDAGRHRVRADARRNLDALLEAAKEVFDASGVDAPVREIAMRAGVGIATVYRHFPQRSDLVAAVYRREVDACVEAAATLAKEHEPGVALVRWIHRYTKFIATKRGLAAAYHVGVPAFEALPAYFRENLEPALRSLLDAAATAGWIRHDVEPYELLRAIANLSTPPADVGPQYSRRMVDLLIDGLRYGARPSTRSGNVAVVAPAPSRAGRRSRRKAMAP
jgi:AcrR family transcriptional regulator